MPKPKLPTSTFDVSIARQVIGSHYDVVCSSIEARAEVLNLERKAGKGTRDDKEEALSVQLEVAYGAKSLTELAKFAYANWACGPNCNLSLKID